MTMMKTMSSREISRESRAKKKVCLCVFVFLGSFLFDNFLGKSRLLLKKIKLLDPPPSKTQGENKLPN